MSKPLLLRLMFYVLACGGLSSARAVFAESHSPVAPAAEDTEVANPADVSGEGSAPNADKPKRTRVASRERTNAKAKAGTGNGKASGGKRRVDRQPTPEYRRIRDAWHAPIAREPVAELPAHLPLVLAPVNGAGERVSIVPQREDGGFADGDLQLAARAFAPVGRKKPHPISPHLLDLVYRSMRHFDATLVHLVSGYRPDRAGSRHTQGRAIDMVIPGVSNEELADYVRTFGYVGVGIYPKSGFVHLDVRESSFFWLDDSLPDEHCRTEPMLTELAKQADLAAHDRGEAPNAYVPNNDREDKAAARAYQKRAVRRRAAAEHVGSL